MAGAAPSFATGPGRPSIALSGPGRPSTALPITGPANVQGQPGSGAAVIAAAKTEPVNNGQPGSGAAAIDVPNSSPLL